MSLALRVLLPAVLLGLTYAPRPPNQSLANQLADACLRKAQSVPCGQLETCCSLNQQCRSGRCHQGQCAGCSEHADCPDTMFCFNPGLDSESLCLRKLPQGGVCSSAAMCGSNICCDHVCSDIACELPEGAFCVDNSECTSGFCDLKQQRCSPPPPKCPEQFQLCGNQCYQLVTMALSSPDAHEACRRRAAPLALPRSDEENQCVQDVSGGVNVWMAMDDNAQEGTFVPSDGRGDAPYTNWTPDNPNNAGGRQNCLHMWNSKQPGGWDDDYCEVKKAYICQTTPSV